MNQSWMSKNQQVRIQLTSHFACDFVSGHSHLAHNAIKLGVTGDVGCIYAREIFGVGSSNREVNE
jgi:hypothetical protein